MSRRLQDERGYVVVVTMCVVLVALLLGAAAVGSAVSTESGVRRDAESRASVQVARAGLETALARTELLVDSGANPRTTCPGGVVAGSQQAGTLVGSWCSYAGAAGASPFVAAEAGVGGQFRYAVSGNIGGSRFERMIVVEGTSDGVTRRVAQRLTAADLWDDFAPYAVFSDQDLTMGNNAQLGDPTIVTSARSNGSISLVGSARICGNATPGPGKAVSMSNGGTVCSGYSTAPASSPLALPPVSIPTTNDNASICPGSVNGSCPPWGSWQATFANQKLWLADNTRMTVTGNTFVLCRLAIPYGDPILTFKPTDPNQPVRVYIKPPEQCGGETNPLHIRNNGMPVVTSSQWPAVQIYIAGSDSVATTVELGNTRPLNLQVYAPRSTFKVDNGITINGALIGRKIDIQGGAHVNKLANAAPMDLGSSQSLKRGPFVECVGTATALNPGAGC